MISDAVDCLLIISQNGLDMNENARMIKLHIKRLFRICKIVFVYYYKLGKIDRAAESERIRSYILSDVFE